MQCHDLEIGQNYDLYYPDLSNVGVHSKSYLREAILEPSKALTRGYETWFIQTFQGETHFGRLLRADRERVWLIVSKDGSFSRREFSKESLVPFDDGEWLRRSPVSEMPAHGLALSAADVESLLTFLMFLRS